VTGGAPRPAAALRPCSHGRTAGDRATTTSGAPLLASAGPPGSDGLPGSAPAASDAPVNSAASAAAASHVCPRSCAAIARPAGARPAGWPAAPDRASWRLENCHLGVRSAPAPAFAPRGGRLPVPSTANVTGLLAAWRGGDAPALDRLVSLIYAELLGDTP
jgi:hypothetical protein